MSYGYNQPSQWTTGRVLWLIWCLLWAAFWTFAAVASFGLTLILTAASVAAFWIPVGKPRPELPPPPPPTMNLPAGYH